MQSGVDYTNFHGLDAAGYRLVNTIRCARFVPPAIGWLLPSLDQNAVHVYRRASNAQAR